MVFALKGKGSLIAAGLTLVAFLVSPTVAFAKDPDTKIDVTRGEFDALEARVAELEAFVQALQPYVSVNPDPMNGLAGPHVILTGANVHVRSGSGATDGTLSGLGNLVVGYNEDADQDEHRTGSHNLVVGPEHTYSSYGGFIAGFDNVASGNHASVSGGYSNRAMGYATSVSGGYSNKAEGNGASVSGGRSNYAMKDSTSISGGFDNFARGQWSSICGGQFNVASANGSSVSGGYNNHASGQWSSVSGGEDNQALGLYSSVSGGYNNTANGEHSTVSGQCGYTATAACEWQPQSNP
jgi:hypothetical protein